MSQVTELANDCIGFYNAVRNDVSRRSATNRDSFRQLMQRGYGRSQPQRARAFLSRVESGSWNELDEAAHLFSRQVGQDEYIWLGTRDFLGAAFRIERLDTRIGQVRLSDAPVPCQTEGFFGRSLSHYVPRVNMVTQSAHWRTEAMAVTRHAEFERISASYRRYVQRHIDGARDLYGAAMGEGRVFMSCGVPEHLRQPFFGQLSRNPDDIWTAYKAALLPSMRHMAQRLSLLMTEEIPMISAVGGLLRSLVGRN